MFDRSPITEDWLRENGFKWHQLERQNEKHWLLWLGGAMGKHVDFEDIGIEVAPWVDGTWFCWLRSDTAHRYSRFIHVRHIRTVGELIRLIEGLINAPFDHENAMYGSLRTPEQAARIRKENERLDLKFMRESPKWAEVEKDDSRGGALPEHLEHHVQNFEKGKKDA